MTITTMHIRDKFYTWIDVGTTKNPRAVCGARTREGLIGIPTVTPQPLVVLRGDTPVWGWCTKCCYLAYRQINDLSLNKITNKHVSQAYVDLQNLLAGPASYYQSRPLD